MNAGVISVVDSQGFVLTLRTHPQGLGQAGDQHAPCVFVHDASGALIHQFREPMRATVLAQLLVARRRGDEGVSQHLLAQMLTCDLLMLCTLVALLRDELVALGLQADTLELTPLEVRLTARFLPTEVCERLNSALTAYRQLPELHDLELGRALRDFADSAGFLLVPIPATSIR